MRAVVCHHSDITVEDVPQPTPAKGQLLLKVLRTGICGSDLHARHHFDELMASVAPVGYFPDADSDSSIVLGHEILGEVVSYGPGTRRSWKPGRRVVTMPIQRTGTDIHMTGFDPVSPGGYAEYVIAQEAFTFPVPDGVSDDAAAFTEPLAVAHHAVRRSGITSPLPGLGGGQPAIVIGCGPIGLAVIMMLKAAGVRTIVASDLSPTRRELAKRCGATVVVDPREQSPWTAYTLRGPIKDWPTYFNFGLDTIGQLRRLPLVPWARAMRLAEGLGQTPTGPVVFECVGIPGMIDHIIDAAPLMTRIMVVGVCMEPDTIHPAHAINKQIDLLFTFGYDPGEFSDTLAMIASGKVDPSPLHTGTVGLDGVAQAFEDLGNPEQHAKILVDPSL